MNRLFFSTLFASILVFSVTGCGKESNTSIVENADQTAIEKYQAAEAAEQAALAGTMEDGSK
ncbi:hypothetical protein [Rubripirellula reticaptiva]|uniref:Uncharacterized protein n=1 Tax=Rubripirellula reticaptiva TaxID=2528013 RepID=A0A5C6ELY0_9BACT|nr:hypothetical protein [Rubripirellula reticaptiva]TWU49137.1 hypothetical protein Poly59_37510 [Rubripirellula reticaptiva]